MGIATGMGSDENKELISQLQGRGNGAGAPGLRPAERRLSAKPQKTRRPRACAAKVVGTASTGVVVGLAQEITYTDDRERGNRFNNMWHSGTFAAAAQPNQFTI